MSTILDGIYRGTFSLNSENVVQTLKAAHLLQMNKIVKDCEDFMANYVDPKTCLQYMYLADMYSLEDVAKAAQGVVKEDFIEVSKTAEFLDLSMDNLSKLLDNDELVGEEIDIFEACFRWIEYKEEERVQFFTEIFSKIHLAFIKMPTLISRVSRCKYVQGNDECTRLVDEAVQYHSDVYSQPLYNGKVNQVRGTLRQIMVFPGSRSTDVVAVLPSSEEGRDIVIKSINTVFNNWSRSSVVCGNFLFVFGIDEKNNSNCFMRLDLITHEVLNLCPLPQIATYGVAMCVIDKEIMCVGGHFKNPDARKVGTLSKQVWKYNIPENSWEAGVDLPIPIGHSVGHRIAATGNLWIFGGSDLVVTGGDSNICPKTSVYEYDTSGKVWLTKPDMLHERSITHQVCEIASELLMVVGGIEVFFSYYCEAFKFQTSQWTFIALPDEIDLGVTGMPLKGAPTMGYSCKYFPSALFCHPRNHAADVKSISLVIKDVMCTFDFESNTWKITQQPTAIMREIFTDKYIRKCSSNGVEFVGPVKMPQEKVLRNNGPVSQTLDLDLFQP